MHITGGETVLSAAEQDPERGYERRRKNRGHASIRPFNRVIAPASGPRARCFELMTWQTEISAPGVSPCHCLRRRCATECGFLPRMPRTAPGKADRQL